MKVLVVGTGGELRGSGITTMADQMVRTLAKMGHEPVRLVAGDRLRRRPNRLNVENVVAVFTEAADVARAVRSSRADVVWLHTFGVPTLPAIRTLIQVLSVRAVGRPIVVEFHAFALEHYVAQSGILQRLTLRVVALLSGHLVAVHQPAAEALRAVAGAHRVTPLHNWVDVAHEPPPPPASPPFRLLFVGGLIERKGVRQLIAAMRLLDDVPVHLCVVGGAGDEGWKAAQAIRLSAEDLIRSGRVDFKGELDAAGVRSALSQAHLLVLPSRAEGMPLAMLEAMAQARAVLVGDGGPMAEVVRQYECGSTVSSQHPIAIATAIRIATSDAQRLASEGLNGHRLARLLEEGAPQTIAAILSATRGAPTRLRSRRLAH